MLYYPRTQLASGLADALQGKATFSDAPNGLFLAAPRRTGKSTFLQSDLIPELARRNVVAVYVDLWADQRRDPGSLIAEAVGRALIKQLGVVAKTAKAAGLDSISLGGIKDRHLQNRPDRRHHTRRCPASLGGVSQDDCRADHRRSPARAYQRSRGNRHGCSQVCT